MVNLRQFSHSSPQIRHNVARRLAQVLVGLLLFAVLLFVSAGTVRWPAAWLYLALYGLTPLIGLFVLPLDVVAERGSKQANVEPWDKGVGLLITVSTLSVFVVAGLDHRWGWSPALPAAWRVAALVALVAGLALVMWAMHVNHYFSTSVRIQDDRGHAVCSAGPYRFVRHPGYVGFLLHYGAAALLFGSLWALVPAAVFVASVVLRTWLEDRTLQAKLPGYAEYAARVRYRLIPRIW